MKMSEHFDSEIKPINEILNGLLGIKTIEVRQISKKQPVRVTRYVRAYGPSHEYIRLTELQLKNAKALGLSIHSAEACNE